MNLRDFIRPSTILKEGGNLEIGGQQAQHIDLQVHNRGYIVPVLDSLLNAINNGYQQRYQEPLWNPKLLKSQEFLSGSSLHFFNTAGISDDDFQRVKPKVGDIDTQVNKANEANLEQYLSSIQGKIVGNAKFLGFSKGNEQYSSLWELTDPPIKVQIDLEFVKFDDKGKSPTEWSQFSHSSSWDDIQEGIKGVFHKWLIQSFASLSEQQFLLRKLVGRGKARAEQDVPTTDNMVSFAVSSTEGGGLRAKYEPVLDEKGQPLVVDGVPVMRALPPEAYEQDIGKIFSSLFGARVKPAEMKKLQSKFWSFTGLIDVMNTIFDQTEKEKVVDAFIDKCFAPGAQGLYKNDPDRDLDEKNAAVNLILSKLKVTGPTNLEQMRNTYKSNYRMTSEAMAENVDSPALDEAEGDTEQPAQVKAQLRKGMPHLHDLKPADLLDLLDEIHDGNGNFKLENIPLNVKVDGFGGRFGKNADGKPFMGTSRTEPRYQAGFVAYHQQKGTTDPEVLGRAKLFDDLFEEMMTAVESVDGKLGSDFLVNKQVTCEVLYLPFATETPEGKLKFVGIHYDRLPEGVQLALVPFRVVDATTGEDLPNSNEFIKELTSVGQSGSVMFIDNSLTQKEGLDVTALVPPLENIEQFKAMLASRKRDQVAEVKAALQPVAAALEKAIIEDPNIVGKDLLGQDYEGIVINSRLGPIKVTSQEQRDVITAKNAAKATARTERPRGEAKTAVVAIGSFIGHKGHEELFDYTIKKAQSVGGDPYLFIGNAEGADDPIPPSVKVETWHKLYPEYAKNISTVQAGGQLIQKVKHELINPLPGKPPRYDNIVIMVGEDRAGMNMPNALMKAVNKFPGYEHVKVSLDVTPRGTGISGTQLRNSLKNDPPEEALNKWSNAFDVNKLGVDWIKHLMDITRKGMGIQEPQQPVQPQQPVPVAEQRLFNALIRPLHEGTSIDSTLRAIINDVGEPITNVYDTMKFQAKKYMENHGELGRGFRMVAAGVGGRWVQNMYVGRLQNELYDLCKYNTRRTVDLQEFLRGVETDGELEMKRSFGNIANNLPPILAKLGEQINAPQLTRNAQRWMQNKAEYERYLMELEAAGDDPDDIPVKARAPKSNAIGQQNAQVDSIINNVLSKVPKSMAGDIRNAIARAPNKLAALKAELDRHNINMAEDNDVMSRMARDLTGPGAPDAKRRAQRDQQRMKDRAQSDGRDHGPKWDVEEAYGPYGKKSAADLERIKKYKEREAKRTVPGQLRKPGTANKSHYDNDSVLSYFSKINQGVAEAFPNPGSGSTGSSKEDKRIAAALRKKHIPTTPNDKKEKGVAEGSYTTEKQILTRIRQIMYDRKLSGTESNAGELYRLKQQLKDIRSQQGVTESTADDVNKLFGNMYDPIITNLQRVALLAMQGRQSEAAGLLQRVIKDADPAVQKKIIDAVNNIKPVTINGRVADSSTLDKSKSHQDWILNTFIPWVQSLLDQQGVAEDSLNELSSNLLRKSAELAKNKRNQAMEPELHNALGGGYMNPLAKHYDDVSQKMDNRAAQVRKKETIQKNKIASPAVMRKLGMAEQGVAEATGDERFDSMMGQIQKEPTIPDSKMPPTDVRDLYQWAVKNNKPYHKIFATWANREGYKSIAQALQKAGNLDSDALDYWTPDVWKAYYGDDSEMPQGYSRQRIPEELRDYLETVFDAYDNIVFDWPTEYRQIGQQGMMETQLDELAGYGGDKKYEHLGTHKRYEVYVTKQKFNNLYFIAIAENPRTLESKFKAKGNTPQEAVNNLKLEIDKEIDVATKVSGQAILDFNVDFVKDILEMSSDTFYAKIVAGPRLVIAGPEMMEYPEIMRDEGFKPSAIRTYKGGEGTTKLPGVPLSSKSAASANLIANGRYVLGNEALDKDGNRVFELNFDSVVQASNDKMRLRAPALTVGTNRSQGVAEAPKSAAVRLGNAIKRVQGTTAASQARSVIPSSIPKPEPKKDEKMVPVSEDIENIMGTLINKIIFNEAISHNK